jgi:hypothetical protein
LPQEISLINYEYVLTGVRGERAGVGKLLIANHGNRLLASAQWFLRAAWRKQEHMGTKAGENDVYLS